MVQVLVFFVFLSSGDGLTPLCFNIPPLVCIIWTEGFGSWHSSVLLGTARKRQGATASLCCTPKAELLYWSTDPVSERSWTRKNVGGGKSRGTTWQYKLLEASLVKVRQILILAPGLEKTTGFRKGTAGEQSVKVFLGFWDEVVVMVTVTCFYRESEVCR